MRGWSRSGAALAALALVAVLAGCVSAHGRAMDAGERAVAARDWDAAVAAYAEASRLDPDDPEARAGLDRARAARMVERTRAIDGLAAAGKVGPALRVAAALVAVETHHPEATRRFDALAAHALEAAAAARAADELEKAIELADAVIEAGRVRVVDAARARSIAGEARAALTERTLAEAESALSSRWYGHAALLVAALEAWGVADPRATALATTARGALRERTTWIVGVRPTVADAERGGLGADVDAAKLQASLDRSFAIRLIPAAAGGAGLETEGAGTGSGGGAGTGRGAGSTDTSLPDAVITLAVRGALPRRTRGQTEGSCAWICGTTTAPNPRIASLRASIEASQQAVRRAERRVDERGRERREAERALEESRRADQAAGDDVEVARRDLSGCRGASSGLAPAERRCATEEQALDRAERAAERADRAERDAGEALARARAEEEAAAQARVAERGSLELATQALASTPATIEIERTCHERYVIEEGTVTADVAVQLAIEQAGRRVEEPLGGRLVVSDRSHVARPGTCSVLAASDPLELPEDDAALHGALDRALVQVRQALVRRDGARRTTMLATARAHAAAGRELDAVEHYALWIAGAPEADASVASTEAAVELARTTGLGATAVVRAVRR